MPRASSPTPDMFIHYGEFQNSPWRVVGELIVGVLFGNKKREVSVFKWEIRKHH